MVLLMLLWYQNEQQMSSACAELPMYASVIEEEIKTQTHAYARNKIAQHFPHPNKFSRHARTHSTDFADTAVVQCLRHTKHLLSRAYRSLACCRFKIDFICAINFQFLICRRQFLHLLAATFPMRPFASFY